MAKLKEFKRLPLPPAADDPNFQNKLARWLRETVDELYQRETDIDSIVNGQIEFPATPDRVTSTSGPNINCIFRTFNFGQPNLGANGVTAAVEIAHGLDRIPRGWFVAQTQSAGRFTVSADVVLDQILCNTFERPFGLGYTSATVTAARTITGAPGAAGRWVNNQVFAGDQIMLSANIAGAATANNAAGSDIVTRPAGDWNTEERLNWWFRFTAGTENNWHQVTLIDAKDPKRMRVQPVFKQAHVAGAYQIRAWDQQWRNIKTVNLGAGPPADSLTLVANKPGTEVPVGTALCEYVIRRPANDRTLWVRVMQQSPDPVVLTLCIF